MSKSTFRSAIAPLLSIAILMLGNGYFTTFVSMRLFIDGYDAVIIGLVQAAYYGGFLIGALKIERLMHRIRHIRAYAFFTCIATAIVLFQGVYVHPIVWMFERFIMGLCIASLYVVIESWLLIIAPDSARGKLLGFYMIALYSAQAISQFFVDILDPVSLSPFLTAGILSSLSMMPVTFTYTQVPEQSEPKLLKFWTIFRKSPFGCCGCIIAGMILSSIYSFVPTYAEKVQLPVSVIMSLTIAGGFLLQWPLGSLSDLMDRRKVLILVSMFTMTPCIGMIAFGVQMQMAMLLAFFLGGFTFTLYPLSITHVTDRHPDADMTSITAVLLFAYSAGSVIGPLVAPFFIDALQPYGLFVYISFMAAALTLIGLISAMFSEPVPKPEQNEFVPLSGQSPLSYELDPRTVSDSDEDPTEELDTEPVNIDDAS